MNIKLNEMMNVTINDREIAYTADTEFLVQVGKGKGAYKTRYSFRGNPYQAVMYFNSINVGDGFKKRLLIPSSIKPVIARVIGY